MASDSWRTPEDMRLLRRLARGARALGKPRVRTAVVLILIGVPVVGFFLLAPWIADALWFQEVGHTDVYVRMQFTKLVLGGAVGGVTMVFLVANVRAVGTHTTVALGRSVTVVATVACAYIALTIGRRAMRSWQVFLLWTHRQSFGVDDPLHHRDIGYFIFTLPFHERVAAFLTLLLGIAFGVTVVLYAIGRAVELRPLRVTHAAGVHLAVLGALVLLVISWRLHLQTYAMEMSQSSPRARQPFPGPHYTDVHVRMPGLSLLSYLAVACAGMVAAVPFIGVVNRERVGTMIVRVVCALALLTAAAVSWAPGLVQQTVVNPTSLTRERPYLTDAIASTRAAFMLDRSRVHPYRARPRITSADVRRAGSALRNIQLWDTSILRLRMHQLGSTVPYYRAYQPTLEAAQRHGHARVTLIGDRELDLTRVRHAAEGWTNARLAFTHGLGAFRFSGTRVDRAGRPGEDNRALPVRQPRIYFGQQMPGAPSWVVVNTKLEEIDTPQAASPGAPEYHYGGRGGIPINGLVRRALFAVRLHRPSLLLSKEMTADSRLIMHRDVRSRLRTLAPFLQWDTRPAALIVDGRIVFLADGYTTSANYPYSQEIDLDGERVDYARAAVKATVDAFSGQVHLYRADPEDPVLRAWSASFPGLFEPISKMPPAVGAQMRYPPALFDAQAALYGSFHATNPGLFAAGSDLWAAPTSLSGSVDIAGDIQFDESDEDDLRHAFAPSYRFASAPGSKRPRLLRSALYSPRRGQNLVATLDGWVDRHGRPHLAARSLPRDRVTPGPAQISRQVFATPRVSNALDVRNREVRDLGRSSLDSVSIGVPHVAFVNGGIVQIQTLYEGSNGRGLARMLGVTAFLNGRAGIGPTLGGALRQALNLPPGIELEKLPRRIYQGRRVQLAFRATNGLLQRVRIWSKKQGTALSRDLHVRNGRGVVEWVPRKAGHVRVRLYGHGLDGSTVVARTAVTVRPPPRKRVKRRGPPPRPTITLGHLPTRINVGGRVSIGFQVKSGSEERLRLSGEDGNAVTWQLGVKTGRGTVEWTPQKAGHFRLAVVVRGFDKTTVQANAILTVHEQTGPKP